MRSRNILPATLLLLGLLALSCAAPATLSAPTEPATPPSATAAPLPQLPTPTASPPLAPAAPSATSAPSPQASIAAATSTPAPIPSPSVAPTRPTGTLLALNDYRFRLIAQFGPPFYCDPDVYPVAHPVSDEQVAQAIATLQKTPQEYEAILRFLGLAGTTNLSAQQKRDVYNEAKLLSSITLDPAAGKYNFSLRVGANDSQGLAISGVIDQNGNITVTKQESTLLTCPRCLTANTLIAAPQGSIFVQDVEPGTMVWTADVNGVRRAAPVLETIRRPVPAMFPMLQLLLADGREIRISPNHPTVDGRVIADLSAGDILDGAQVVGVASVPYAGGWTYDILPAGDTGTYWANDIFLKSTLAK